MLSEENIKFIKSFLKEVHGYSETQITKFFANEQSAKDAIESAKAVASESYDEGLLDGTKNVKKVVVESLKNELGIKITAKDLVKIEDIGGLVKPLIEAKFASDTTTETDLIKQWREKYERVVEEKDVEVEKARSEAGKQIDNLRRLSVAKDILTREGYKIPENSADYDTKLQMVTLMLQNKEYAYEHNKEDGKDYRINADNSKVRSGNKYVTFEDDFKSLAEITFGKLPADEKNSGFSNSDAGGGAGTGQGGAGKPAFDWTAFKTKGIDLPTDKVTARQVQNNVTIPLEDRLLASDFIKHLDATDKATT